MRRRVWLLCALLAVAAPAVAQVPEVTLREDSTLRQRVPQKWRFLAAGIGAAILGIPAYVAVDLPNRDLICSSRACSTAVAAALGAGVGFLIGREMDEAAGRRSGSTTAWAARPVELPAPPVRLETFAGGAVVIGQNGFTLIQGDLAPEARATSLQDVLSVGVLPSHGTILVATSSNLFALPLESAAPGQPVATRGAGRIVTLEDGTTYLAGFDLRRVSLAGMSANVVVTEEAQRTSMAPIVDLAHSAYGGVLWALSRDRVVAHSPSGLEEIGAAALPFEARTLSLSGGRALVSAGAEGIALLDVSQPSAPRLLQRMTGVAYVFDAVMRGNTAWLAAGRAGLLEVDLTNPSDPVIRRALRNIGRVIDVAVTEEGVIYAVSQDMRRLYVLGFEESGQD